MLDHGDPEEIISFIQIAVVLILIFLIFIGVLYTFYSDFCKKTTENKVKNEADPINIKAYDISI